MFASLDESDEICCRRSPAQSEKKRIEYCVPRTPRTPRKEPYSMFDVIIRNGQVIDGTGQERFRADVGIVGDKIVKIGDLSADQAERVIDADGMVVCPGFIDIHSHEQSILADAHADSKIRQGVTTEVMGNCGISMAPVHGKGGIETAQTLMGAFDVKLPDINWSSTAEFLDFLENRGVVTNYLTLVGHGIVRASVMGLNDRQPSDEEMKAMKAVVARAMEDGAWGMSTGLIYLPALFSKTNELVELAKVVASFGGIYASHIRGEHYPFLKPAIEEAIEVGRKANIPVEISHFKAYGKKSWGQASKLLAILEAAVDEGVKVNADAYPYVATHTTLNSVLPGWVQEGGKSLMVERLKQPELRRKAREDIAAGRVIYFNESEVGWKDVMIVHSRIDPSRDGLRITEIAKREGKDPYDMVFDILTEEPGILANYFALSEEDVQTFLKHPLVMVGSDGYASNAKGVLGKGKPHPRFYGTFPRVLGKYAREEGLFTLTQAVMKMTSMPARKIGLTDRGVLNEGACADVVVLDPETVTDRATFTDPKQYPDGIPYVLVNGQVVVEAGDYTGQLVGKVLRRK